MHESVMKKWIASSHFNGGSMAYVEALYEAYLDDPSSVDQEWSQIFDSLPKVNGSAEIKHSVIRDQFEQLAKKQTPRSSYHDRWRLTNSRRNLS